MRLKVIGLRRAIVEMIRRAGTGHPGGSLSCVDILAVLYDSVLRVDPARTDDPARDRYIHSKGHAAEALYAVLSDRGFFSPSHLSSLLEFGSPLQGHPHVGIPGVEHATGALGHGLPVAVGMALAGRLSGREFRVFVLVGDGELAEGSNWEAMLCAAHHKLENLVLIVDYNGLQISGRTEAVSGIRALAAKFRAFDWRVADVDGHDIGELRERLSSLPLEHGAPSAIIAKTTKGRGIDFMEDQASWHHRGLNDEEYAAAIDALDRAQQSQDARDDHAPL